eukprot:171034_1
MDVSDANTYFEWKVNNYLMEKWKNAIYHDAFFSPTFNAIGGERHIRIYPNAAANGWSTQGEAELDIVCQSIESEEKEINICDYIEIKPLNHYQIHFDGNSVKKGESVTCNSPFKWNDIKNESEITICIGIWRTEATSDEKRETKRQMESLCHENKEITSKLKEFAMRDLKQQQQITKLQKK